MVGEDDMKIEWWPAIADALALPWPKEAAMMDLSWWETQPVRRPGRTLLARRWGWTPRRVRALLEETR